MRFRTVLVLLGVFGAGFAAALAALRYRPRLPSLPGGDDRLDDLTKDELYQRARAAEIPGRSEMTKDELIRASQPFVSHN